MTRTCMTFPFTIENGGLKLSSGFDRDEQDAIATIMTRHYERVLRPFFGTPDYTFRALNAPNLISQKLAVAIEEQCPTIASCTGTGSTSEEGTVVANLSYAPKEQPERVRSLTIGVTD